MGKRSDFKHIVRDCYDTPAAAMRPLLVHLPKRFRFLEPCAGRGALLDCLVAAGGECVGAFDIEPRRRDIGRHDAMTMTSADVHDALIITNPPHSRGVLHPLIALFASLAPTWLLLDSDWKENVGSAELVGHLEVYQPIGRLVWMPGTAMAGKENYGWCSFGRARSEFYQAYARLPSLPKVRNLRTIPKICPHR
jgi:hypothetical protein